MIPYEMQHISLSQIEIFFRCAETMNFTKAAESLLITPGMVSKKIAALESVLGFALFSRDKNRVTLTSEGEALYTAWRQPAQTMTNAVTEIRNRQSQNNVVTLCLATSLNLERFLVPLLSACTTDTALSFRIVVKDDLDILEALTTGRIDVAFVVKHAAVEFSERDDVEHILALRSPLYAALSPENPLARKNILHVEDLRDMVLLIGDIPDKKWYVEMLIALCQKHGFMPTFRQLDLETYRNSYLSLDAKSVLIIDKYFFAFSSRAAEYRELENTESGLVMLNRKSASPQVRKFVEYARFFYTELR